MEGTPRPARQLEWLIAPLISAAALAGLLVAARFYDRLPVTPPPCAFREAFDIPCLGCGGTRAMRALAGGDLASSLRFNPAVPLALVAILVWVSLALFRYFRGTPRPPLDELNRRFRRNAVVVGSLLVLDWIYLLLSPP